MASQLDAETSQELSDISRAVHTIKQLDDVLSDQSIGTSTGDCISQVETVLQRLITARESFERESRATFTSPLVTAGMLKAETGIANTIKSLLELQRKELNMTGHGTNLGFAKTMR